MNNDAELKRITGVGLKFPINLTNGKADLSYGFDLVKSCLNNILAFEYGERFFLYEFGLKLRRILEDPVDEVVENLLDYNFEVILPQWDDRIRIDNVTITRYNDQGKVKIDCRLSIPNTLAQDNYSYTYNLPQQNIR